MITTATVRNKKKEIGSTREGETQSRCCFLGDAADGLDVQKSSAVQSYICLSFLIHVTKIYMVLYVPVKPVGEELERQRETQHITNPKRTRVESDQAECIEKCSAPTVEDAIR